MFACSSQPGKECKSCYTSFSSRWGCSGSTRQLWGTAHFNYPAETCTCLRSVGRPCQQSHLNPPCWSKCSYRCTTGWATQDWCTTTCTVFHIHPLWGLLHIPLVWIQIDKWGQSEGWIENRFQEPSMVCVNWHLPHGLIWGCWLQLWKGSTASKALPSNSLSVILYLSFISSESICYFSKVHVSIFRGLGFLNLMWASIPTFIRS